MIGDDDTVRRAAKTALTQVINATFKRAEKDFERLSSGESSTPTTSEALGDVERLLLTLCKIAAKEGSVAVDAYLAHSKALALDVLRQLMEGPRATSWLERLHASLRQPLSMALARNALLQVPQGAEAEQSVGILVSLARMAYGTLVVRARSTWKQQVAALYPIMAIHPLESGEAAAMRPRRASHPSSRERFSSIGRPLRELRLRFTRGKFIRAHRHGAREVGAGVGRARTRRRVDVFV